MATIQTAQIIPFPVRTRAAWPAGAIGAQLEVVAQNIARARGTTLTQARQITIDAYEAAGAMLKSNRGEL